MFFSKKLNQKSQVRVPERELPFRSRKREWYGLSHEDRSLSEDVVERAFALPLSGWKSIYVPCEHGGKGYTAYVYSSDEIAEIKLTRHSSPYPNMDGYTLYVGGEGICSFGESDATGYYGYSGLHLLAGHIGSYSSESAKQEISRAIAEAKREAESREREKREKADAIRRSIGA